MDRNLILKSRSTTVAQIIHQKSVHGGKNENTSSLQSLGMLNKGYYKFPGQHLTIKIFQVSLASNQKDI